MSVTFVLFPMLAHAQAASDKAAVRRYVENGVRLAAVVAGLLVSVTAGLPRGLIGLVFGHDTAVLGAPAMQILAVGLGFLALFGILTAVLNSLGQERASLIVTGLAFLLVVALCFLFVRGGAFGEGLLERTAWATSAGLVVATLAAAAFVARVAGGVVPALSLVRVALGVVAATFVGHLLPDGSKVMTLVYAPVVASIYVAALTLTRELNSQDLANLKAVVRR
jgi:O-antigen/teichoic acid export membrane protein